jgi:hypothetical protein
MNPLHTVSCNVVVYKNVSTAVKEYLAVFCLRGRSPHTEHDPSGLCNWNLFMTQSLHYVTVEESDL